MTMELIRPEVSTPSMPIDQDELLILKREQLTAQLGALSTQLNEVSASYQECINNIIRVNEEIRRRELGFQALERMRMVNITPELAQIEQ
jgi:hypothetical protein